MKRIIVIGLCGSGKSYVSGILGKKLNLPVYHLDMLFWKEDKTNVSNEEFDEKLREVLKNDEWIIDGFYTRTLQMRLERCDTAIVLDTPLEYSIENIRKRTGTIRDDLPWVEDTEDSEELVEWVKDTYINHKNKMNALLEETKNVEIIRLKSREEIDNYLNSL